MLKKVCALALIAALAGCAVTAPEIVTSTKPPVPGMFTPPNGKALFVVGAELEAIEGYMKGFQIETPGVASITSLEKLEGIETEALTPNGRMHANFLMNRHPLSAMALGVTLNGYLDKINSGAADGQIDKLLDTVYGYERPVYLRLGFGFDDPANGYDPAAFKKAWARIANRLTAKNIDNVVLVWQSATLCNGASAEAWYPGDEYVDWVGFSFTSQAACGYKPIADMLAFARARHKPAMIAEAYPLGYSLSKNTFSKDGITFEPRSNAQIWSEWFAPFLDTVYRHNDVIRAVVYANSEWTKYPQAQYRGDARLQTNPELTRHWVAEMARVQWVHTSSKVFEELGY
jgi:hypothetical protein